MPDVFVGSLPPDFTDSQLRDLFKTIDPGCKAKVIRAKPGAISSIGFVTLKTPALAETAIQIMHDHKLANGVSIIVNHPRPRIGHPGPASVNPPRTAPAAAVPLHQLAPPPAAGPPQGALERFYNPYTFVPTPPRDHLARDIFAGDLNPLTHGLVHNRLQEEHWTGSLAVIASVVTPLVLPAPNPDGPKGEHQTYNCKTCPEPSEIRGMLRSAYETITNSRLHGFGEKQHMKRLGLRMEASDSLPLVPARVINSGGGLRLELLPGESAASIGKKPDKMYAAWLPRYSTYFPAGAPLPTDKGENTTAKPFTDANGISPPKPFNKSNLPQHGDRVHFKLSKLQTHPRRGFNFFRVDEVRIATGSLPADFREGYACITGPNIKNKHDERIFFTTAAPISTSAIGDKVRQTYELLIADYQDLHKDDREPADMPKYKGTEPGKTGYSRQVWEKLARKLAAGDLVYAKVVRDGASWKATAIYPVMISRDLYECPPGDLLPNSLKHATAITDLSPADRLFGWVKSKKDEDVEKEAYLTVADLPEPPVKSDQGKEAQGKDAAAYRGRIRVSIDRNQPSIESNKMETFGSSGIPLAILGPPKPAQGGFYVAKDKNGTAQEPNQRKDIKGYRDKNVKGLRGRKYYWHQRQSDSYWSPFNNGALIQDARSRLEYLLPPLPPGKKMSNQNRSIRGWIAPRSTFIFSIHVTNATDEELGALLWLLSRHEGVHFRLGYGKPLGFGSLQLKLHGEATAQEIAKGSAWKAYYGDLFAPLPKRLGDTKDKDSQKNMVTLAIESFMKAMVAAYPPADGRNNTLEKNFLSLGFIAGFLRVGQGPPSDFPIHYPRRSPNNRNDDIFAWFGKAQGEKTWKGHSLPAVTPPAGKDGSIPYNPINP